jgi:hypothetical protein
MKTNRNQVAKEHDHTGGECPCVPRPITPSEDGEAVTPELH